ncbi:5-hydroxytryptamine receptor 2C isoform X1 [Alligator mississippiensis]|uniref:5-hydroxytryptamine receptor 2C n=1 Tax=Alligator mississippiensis TaxID=8496 RepID=A0A151N7D9_ALLMI|nr:5-hydroxytryptamine receptor 2C isoform X1 [Alligator mississippiensis]XP_059588914.1 5-hydroxytryptamine receptor 2C isoform X1 [Alligator mississippiensis]XP_059588915.1 5-hydroxytryptamine receptor 2C isoform X1 [Alligator mississippiensis]XP_059588916.1 5-hydroxytryptamine receptor 2C isoform X1 [Alligator mississippiensis]XP_059588917.1 5-hydroxytryptamine receptor 2C isoform X1 [Alligator mississippiensis]KYO32706.1 5-hydroxytryptamine receptor 2C [Alligator mississippiensis]
MMSTLSGAGIFVSLTTVSETLDFSLHGGLMAWPLSSNLTLNQSLPTFDPFNTSEKEEVSRMSIREKNWPALLILVIIVLTIGGNILVIMAVSLEKKLQNATNYFLMSLAVADMLVGILVMPVSLVTVLYVNQAKAPGDGLPSTWVKRGTMENITTNYAWPLPKQLCPIWISLDVLFSTASIMHLCAISLDRYVAIRNPIEHSRFNSRTKAIMKIAAVWTISIGISSPIPVIGLQDDSRVFVSGRCVLNERKFVLVGSFVAFFVPLVIMVITYCLTVQVLQRQATVFMYGEMPKQRRSSMSCLKKENTTENISMLQNHEGTSHLNSPANKEAVLFRKGTMQSINNERRASKVLGIVFFLFLIMWCPFFITNVMSVLCTETCSEDLLAELLDVFVWVGYVCSGVNPLVYTLFNKTYRRAFSNYIRCQYKANKTSTLRQNQCPNVPSTASYGKDLNLNSYRNGNEFNSMELGDIEEGLEMQPGTSQLSINSCNVVSERVSCV